MSKIKQLEIDQMDHDCDSDLEVNYKSKEKTPVGEDRGEPMSINRPFDNAAAWLDDEPWRTW